MNIGEVYLRRVVFVWGVVGLKGVVDILHTTSFASSFFLPKPPHGFAPDFGIASDTYPFAAFLMRMLGWTVGWDVCCMIACTLRLNDSASMI